jgi:hypothetical protein
MVILGKSPFRHYDEVFKLSAEDRRRHVYIIGKSGTGKSTLLEHLIAQDLEASHGVAVLDPHGELAERILDLVPKRRINEVIYFNPKDRSNPIPLNLLWDVKPEKRSLVVEGIVTAFKNIWHDSWGPRLEYILTACLAALCEAPKTSLLHLPTLLTDASFREKKLHYVTDPLIQSFFDDFNSWNERLRQEAIAPVLNKVGALLLSQPLRYTLGQVKNTFDFRDLIDGQKIFIANLSKGNLGSQSANLLGSLLVTQFQLAAMSRANIPQAERKDFYLYVDEFQSFATRSFAEGLSELRKYHCAIIAAHQYLAQLNDEVREAVFGNVGTLISFAVGESDAPTLASEFYPEFRADDLIDLSRGEMIFKRSVRGRTQKPERAYTYEPLKVKVSQAAKIIRESRYRYGIPMRKVERVIKKSLN